MRPDTRSSLRFALLIAAALIGGAALGAPVRTAHVEAELVPEKTAITPGGTLTVALRMVMERGWHTYWRNPGESGLPTTLAWKPDSGLKAGPIQWPAPSVLPAGPLVNYGYEGEVLLLSDLVAPDDLATGRTVRLDARADWLVCREICIPEGADLSLEMPVAERTEADPRWATAIAATRAAIPRPLAGWQVAATGHGDQVDLVLTPQGGASDPGQLRFFPYSPGQVEPSAPQVLTRDGAGWKLALPVASQRVGDFTRVAGVLTASRGFGGGDVASASIDVPLAGGVVAGRAAPAAVAPVTLDAGAGNLSLGLALVFAFLGGMLLNLMPCVFPVLSLKVFGFAAHGFDSGALRAHGLAFGGGVIVSFGLLAGVLIALRAGGAQLGWGFQLQSPAVVAALAVLFFVLALNLSGVFEMGQVLPSAVSTWTARNTFVNDALSGVLAVAIASPCSAPFMGAAVGYALAQSAAATLGIFLALGIGMALPYVLLAFFPGWRKYLPFPGPWMLRLKQVLAFPLYATVIWLAWVLGAQLDNDAVARLGLALLLIAAALWAWQVSRTGGALRWRWVAIGALVAAMAVGVPVTAVPVGSVSTVGAAAEDGWQDYAPERVSALVNAGRPVFVDFTAAWCVTCQVNKRLVLNTDTVRQAFARNDVALLRADWTRRDATIGRALAALGRSGVPVYVLYRPGREPVLLPEVLTESAITGALAELQSPRLVSRTN
jgi:thiol:disulfide interchange protein DsbD